jgi:Trk-type K+ transport system membrane component
MLGFVTVSLVIIHYLTSSLEAAFLLAFSAFDTRGLALTTSSIFCF